MPAAKKPATRSSGRAASRSATRREVERAIARFEKRLEEANDALAALGKDLGRGAQGSYKDVTAALRALRRDAQKTNRQVLRDFDKLRAAVTPTRTTARPGGRRTTARRGGSRTTARSSGSRSSRSSGSSTGSSSTSA